MFSGLKETFNMWVDFIKNKDIDCVCSVKPEKSSEYYNQIMIADRGLRTHRLTLEKFVDEKHIDTRLIIKLINLTASESLDIIHAFDRISGTDDEYSRANFLKDSDNVDYVPSEFVNVKTYDELMDKLESLGSDKVVYSEKQRLEAAKALPSYSRA